MLRREGEVPMWRKQRLAVYVTLLPNSNMAEWYVVLDTDDGTSDLASDGFCKLSKLPSALADSLSALLEARMVEASQ
jgi:hypothetical protein